MIKKFLSQNKNITKTILVITAMASVIAILVASVILDRVVESHDEERMKFIAADIYDDINTELLKLVMIARVMSKDIPLIESIQNEENITFEQNVYLMANYMTSLKESFKLSTAFIVSEKSKIYYSPEGFNKIVDVENDAHDIWYKLFLDKNLAYDYDIDVDEINQNNWTIFVSARINDAEGNLIGVCGAGEYLTEIQNLLITDEQTYDVKINLVNQQGVIQLDADFLNIETAHLQNIVNPNKSTQFILEKNDGVYTITKFMPDLGLYLVVRRNAENTQGTFSNLVIYMVGSFVIATLIFLIFMRVALTANYTQVEKMAKKHGLASYADLYISMHLIDLQENSIHEISNDPEFDLFTVNEQEKASEQIIDAVKEMTVAESLKKMLKFVNLDTISERLKERNVIHCEFLSKNYGWCKAYFIASEFDKNHTINQIIFAIELIDEEKNRENNLIYLAQTDLMTGLKNRGSGEKEIRNLIEKGGEGIFFMMDADKFKSINDNYGHDVGDKVIRAIADCLKKTFRAGDVVMRIGGDEFAAYAVGIVDAAEGNFLIEKFFAEINQINIPELGERKISISVGSAIVKAEENLSAAEIYKRADLAAYESKKIAGNFYTSFGN